jgi:HEAT repeat protein
LKSVDEVQSLIADLTSGDDQIAESALPHLAQMGEAALDHLRQLLTSTNPDHRWWAVRSLSYFQSSLVGDSLASALFDPDPSVQYCAALSLRYAPSPQAIPHLINTLESKDRLLARLAGDALSAIGEEAIPALAETLQSSHPASRGEAARALAKMGIPDVIPILYSAAEDPSSIVQYWVEDGFERLGVGMVYFKP